MVGGAVVTGAVVDVSGRVLVDDPDDTGDVEVGWEPIGVDVVDPEDVDER